MTLPSNPPQTHTKKSDSSSQRLHEIGAERGVGAWLFSFCRIVRPPVLRTHLRVRVWKARWPWPMTSRTDLSRLARAIERIDEVGRRQWRKESGAHRPAQAENGMYRYGANRKYAKEHWTLSLGVALTLILSLGFPVKVTHNLRSQITRS